MIDVLKGFIFVVIGVFFVWCGSFQIIMGMLPKDYALKTAEKHGAWVRENVFRLPPLNEKKQ